MRGKMRTKTLILLAILCLLLLAAGYMAQQAQVVAEEEARLREKIEFLEVENARLRERVTELREQQAELGDRMQGWLDAWEVQEAEVTAYAPLDDAAVEGMCYAGDPSITASGAPVVPGITVAAGPDVPFGTRMYVQGCGWRVVQDRGGRIGTGCIDLAVETMDAAKVWGRQSVKVVREK